MTPSCYEKTNVVNFKKIKVSPNPFNNKLRIEGCSEVKIYDISGKFIAEIKDKWNGRDRKGEDVKPGIYFLRSQDYAVKKVVKLR